MPIRRRGWELRESEATPEAVFLDRGDIVARDSTPDNAVREGKAGAPRQRP